ncbi:hypothetical protein BHS09_36410 [Myxococcus xanthus]|uniref:HTH marR-type domain-containing protein n=1 Tax=Myxococcus xanthus TaxID=34 RepID=A0AAE6G6T3_MYXXA|nr:hypothetical protein BHS09_36410 [Myxococcus xanthus]QDE79311.1 hypothetical protein BHS08_36435 [Myxococcus xanthus]
MVGSWGVLPWAVISSVAADIAALGLETKELFVLAEVDAHPYPAELAAVLCIPKPSVTLYVKRLEAAGFLRREIDTSTRSAARPWGGDWTHQGTNPRHQFARPRVGALSSSAARKRWY